MSRHSELSSTTSNPCNLRLTWKSSDKRFIAYDTITKTKTTLGNISFIVLAETVSICGFNEQHNLGIFSNEIKNTQNEELCVRTKNGILVEGLYADIKAKLGPLGGNFAQNLYVQLKTGELAVLQLSGAVLKEWFNYKAANGNNISTHWVTITGINDMKKGAVKYSVPVLTLGTELTADEDNRAELLYNKITAYRKQSQPKSLDDIIQAHGDDDLDMPDSY